MTISPRRGQRQAEMVTREISKLPRSPPHVQNRSEARMRAVDQAKCLPPVRLDA